MLIPICLYLVAIVFLNSSLTNENSETFNFGVKDGVRGFFTDPSRADDSFVPFNNDDFEVKAYDETGRNSFKNFTADTDYVAIIIFASCSGGYPLVESKTISPAWSYKYNEYNVYPSCYVYLNVPKGTYIKADWATGFTIRHKS